MKEFLTEKSYKIGAGLLIGLGILISLGTFTPTQHLGAAQVLSGPQGGTDHGFGSLAASNTVLVARANGQWQAEATSSLGLGGGGSGTVTSVDVSGGTTGLTTSGGAITTSGTITIAGTLIAVNGGTGLSSIASSSLLIGGASNTILQYATSSLGLKTSSFLSTNISQWANDSLYITFPFTVNATNNATGTLLLLSGGVMGGTASNTLAWFNSASSSIGTLAIPSIQSKILITDSNGLVSGTTSPLSLAFYYSTTTPWVATDTISRSGYPWGITMSAFGCASEGGTVNVQVGNGSASTTMVTSATGNTTTFTTLSSNNSFTSGQKIYFAIGTPSVSTVHAVTCSNAYIKN